MEKNIKKYIYIYTHTHIYICKYLNHFAEHLKHSFVNQLYFK